MKSAIVVLKRSVSMPKQVWRDVSTRRTLDPVSLDLLLPTALQNLPNEPLTDHLILEADIVDNGAALAKVAMRPVHKTDWSGIFTIKHAGETVEISLSQEACRREVYTPRRSSQHLATLAYWEPVRAILNGKADWSSGRYYYLQDYYTVLCDKRIPGVLRPTKTFDFQADLI